MKYVVGIDEVGRGPIAGPVAVGVFLGTSKYIRSMGRIRDSKKLTEGSREGIFKKMKRLRANGKVEYSVSMVSNEIIDKRGISHAINLAIKRGLKKVVANPKNSQILLDGRLFAPVEFKNQKTIIRGDEKETSIALASIVAKVTRDRYMVRLSKKFPKYGFGKHKGYGTRDHYKAIKKHGLTKFHRKSFLTKR